MLLATKFWLRIFVGLVGILIVEIFLSLVFSGRMILPQAFRLGFLTVHYYGIIMALAVAAGFYLAIKRASAYGLKPEQADSLLFWLVAGGFMGARAYHIFSSFAYYLRNPLDMFKVWNGGLSIYGAVLGGLLTLWIVKRFYATGAKFLSLLDWLAPGVALGQAIGRLGNFFNYEAFGYPANLPWKMFVPESFRPFGYASYSYFHPWFLYEALGDLLIFFLLLKFKKSRPAGSLFLGYLLLYNILRFDLEFLRIDSVFIGNLRQNALVSLCLAVLAAGLLVFLNKSHVKAS